MKNIFFLFIFTICQSFLFSQEFFFDLTKALPQNYVKDGSIDYTNFIQKAINKNKNVLFPDFPLLINYNGLKLKSSSVYKFQENSKLIMQKTNKPGYNMLDCNNKENISIIGAILIGDRKTHLGNEGEWGFGISLRGSRNISIENVKIYDCFGDGIYIGRLNNKISKNIIISNAYVNNSRRNGLSITSGIDVKICDSKFISSNGKGPSSGIDIEPNSAEDEIENIRLDNIETNKNENWGLLINLVNLSKNITKEKKVTIFISNYLDNESKYGLSFWLNRNINNDKNIIIKGNIFMGKIKLVNNFQPIKFFSFYKNNINVNISDLTVNGQNRKKIKDILLKYKKNKRIKISNLKYVN